MGSSGHGVGVAALTCWDRTAAFAAVLAVLSLSACSSVTGARNVDQPSYEESVGFLARIVESAGQGDFEALCRLGDGNCETHLEKAGIEAVPPDPPIVVATRVVAHDPASGAIGGRVLTVCGVDGRGQRYRSEMLIFRDGDGLRAINPVYWDGVTIAGEGDTTLLSPEPPGGC